MNVESYLKKRAKLQESVPRFRDICGSCRQPQFTCYCRHIRSFDPKVKFVILIQHLEFRRRIATGRMAHLCLENSELIRGYDYSDDRRINELINQPQNYCVILYPGRTSTNLTPLTIEQKRELFPANKQLVIFILDGTWSTAKKMLNRSRNLQKLPQIAFSPQRPSNFRVRKQPKELCVSSLEAIHETIELLGSVVDFDVASRAHDNLLHVFDQLVSQQLRYVETSHQTRTHSRHYKEPTTLSNCLRNAEPAGK